MAQAPRPWWRPTACRACMPLLRAQCGWVSGGAESSVALLASLAPVFATASARGLVGLCFNCLQEGHVKAHCKFPSCWHTCQCEGQWACSCPSKMSEVGAKCGHSPSRAAGHACRFREDCFSPARWSRSVDMVSRVFASMASHRLCRPHPRHHHRLLLFRRPRMSLFHRRSRGASTIAACY